MVSFNNRGCGEKKARKKRLLCFLLLYSSLPPSCTGKTNVFCQCAQGNVTVFLNPWLHLVPIYMYICIKVIMQGQTFYRVLAAFFLGSVANWRINTGDTVEVILAWHYTVKHHTNLLLLTSYKHVSCRAAPSKSQSQYISQEVPELTRILSNCCLFKAMSLYTVTEDDSMTFTDSCFWNDLNT